MINLLKIPFCKITRGCHPQVCRLRTRRSESCSHQKYSRDGPTSHSKKFVRAASARTHQRAFFVSHAPALQRLFYNKGRILDDGQKYRKITELGRDRHCFLVAVKEAPAAANGTAVAVSGTSSSAMTAHRIMQHRLPHRQIYISRFLFQHLSQRRGAPHRRILHLSTGRCSRHTTRRLPRPLLIVTTSTQLYGLTVHNEDRLNEQEKTSLSWTGPMCIASTRTGDRRAALRHGMKTWSSSDPRRRVAAAAAVNEAFACFGRTKTTLYPHHVFFSREKHRIDLCQIATNDRADARTPTISARTINPTRSLRAKRTINPWTAASRIRILGRRGRVPRSEADGPPIWSRPMMFGRLPFSPPSCFSPFSLNQSVRDVPGKF
jgi:hypothetical protein